MEYLAVAILVGMMIYYEVKEIVFLAARRYCRIPVTAYISGSRECGRTKHGRLYRFTVSYSYGEAHYLEEMTHNYHSYAFAKGEEVAVLIDENEPSRFLAVKEKERAVFHLIAFSLLLLFAVLLFIGCMR